MFSWQTKLGGDPIYSSPSLTEAMADAPDVPLRLVPFEAPGWNPHVFPGLGVPTAEISAVCPKRRTCHNCTNRGRPTPDKKAGCKIAKPATRAPSQAVTVRF